MKNFVFVCLLFLGCASSRLPDGRLVGSGRTTEVVGIWRWNGIPQDVAERTQTKRPVKVRDGDVIMLASPESALAGSYEHLSIADDGRVRVSDWGHALGWTATVLVSAFKDSEGAVLGTVTEGGWLLTP